MRRGTRPGFAADTSPGDETAGVPEEGGHRFHPRLSLHPDWGSLAGISQV